MVSWVKASPLDPEFVEYEPLDFAAEEEPGSLDWPKKNGTLDYIRSMTAGPLPPLDPRLEALLDHAWKSAKPSNPMPPPPGAPFIAGHRAPPPPNSIGAHRVPNVANPVYTPITVPPVKHPSATFNLQTLAAPHLKTAFAQDWNLQKDIPRVRAFAFRGDTRTPQLIRGAGGFQPPITRNDSSYLEKAVYPQFSQWLKARARVEISLQQFLACVQATMTDRKVLQDFIYYGTWRALVAQEQFHLGRMLANETLKGFVSTTRATTVAKGFAKTNGWVYLLMVDGGYLVPDKEKHSWTTIFGEQEIAFPGSVPWNKIFAYRNVGGGKFTGPIYMRKGFEASEPKAVMDVYQLLSGKRQRGSV